MKKYFPLIALLALNSIAFALPHADNLAKAVETAKTSAQDIIIYAHGPGWDNVSTNFKDTVWKSKELEELTKDFILTEMPLYENPTEEQKKELEETKNLLKSYPNSLPALFIADPSGKNITIISGRTLIQPPIKALAVVKEKIEARLKQKELMKLAESATGPAKAKLIGQACELGLEHPNDALKLIKEADPEDKSNYAKRFELNTWAVIGKINEEKDLAQAKELAKSYTSNEAYTPLQRQEIWVSIIGRMRREDATNKSALKEACLAMKALDPKSLYGTVADTVMEKCCSESPSKK